LLIPNLKNINALFKIHNEWKS